MVGTRISAQELFRTAYENRYTWDKSFPGYTADVTYTHNGQVYEGTATVTADLKATVEGIEDEAAAKSVHNQLFEVAIHRVRRPFEASHGQNTFSYGQPQTDGAVEILVGGKGEGDRYQVRNDEVTLVYRHIHGVVVTIHTFSTHDTGAGYLAHRYDSVYHDPNTGEQKGGLSDFEDTYEAVGDFQILSRRYVETVIDGRDEVQEFKFSNIQLTNA